MAKKCYKFLKFVIEITPQKYQKSAKSGSNVHEVDHINMAILNRLSPNLTRTVNLKNSAMASHIMSLETS